MAVLFTENLTLREFKLTDYRQHYKNNKDEQIRKFLSFRSYQNKRQAKKEIKNWIHNYQEKTFPCNLAIIKTNVDKLIGHIGIGVWDISSTEHGYEIEYAIAENFRGYHYAAEALGAFCQWCKNEFVLDIIFALVDKENIPSCKTLKSAGFMLYEGKAENKKDTSDVYFH